MPGGRPKGLPKTGGRQKGTPNKRTALLKDAILEAADAAGGPGGVVAYLTAQAIDNPSAFMTLLGKVLPTQVTGEDGGAVKIEATVSDDLRQALDAIAGKIAGGDGAG
jgi:hypothetical protein